MSLESLRTRLQYYGGSNQQQRMIKDKLRSLKKALLYSYQAATAILPDGREFRCLINPDKNKPDYDNKIISIPFRDICLNKRRIGKTSEGQEETKIKTGDTFVWKENNSHWLIFLQNLSEKAYFRSQIRRCDSEIKINDKSYWVYIRGPLETTLDWRQEIREVRNSLNYSIVMYITADENTNSFFQRFALFKVSDPRDNKEKTWQVSVVNPYYGDGIIQVCADEYYENSIQQAVEKENLEKEKQNENSVDLTSAYIDGPKEIQTYSMNKYVIKNISGGSWYINWFGQEINLQCDSDTLVLENPSKQQGKATLIYRIEGQQDILLNIKIVSL